jgi:hypothetical protein
MIKILINMEPETAGQPAQNKLQEAQASKMNNMVDDRQGMEVNASSANKQLNDVVKTKK